MRIGNAIIDTDNMTVEEIDILYHEVHRIRARKREALSAKHQLQFALEDAKKNGFTFCSKHTGEIMQIGDWHVYDEKSHCIHGDELGVN